MANSSSLLKAVVGDDRETVRELLKENPQSATQSVALSARYDAAIAHWIYAGDTALHVAAAAYRVEIATILLSAGADPNAAKNHRRSGPLHYACDGYLQNPSWNPKRQVAMIRLLLQWGADLRAQDKNGATPLHRAVRTRCAAAVECLLDAGADATIKNKPGSTPFHLAVQDTGRGGSGTDVARAAQRDIVAAFLQRGVSTGLRDRKGKSVMQWARSGTVLDLLQREAS